MTEGLCPQTISTFNYESPLQVLKKNNLVMKQESEVANYIDIQCKKLIKNYEQTRDLKVQNYYLNTFLIFKMYILLSGCFIHRILFVYYQNIFKQSMKTL